MRKQLVQDLGVLLLVLSSIGLGSEHGKNKTSAQLNPLSEAQQTQTDNLNRQYERIHLLSTIGIIAGSCLYFIPYKSKDN